MPKPKLIIFGDPKRRYAAEAVDDFVHFAAERARIIANCFHRKLSVDVLKEADFAVVFGGDGTILSAARDLSEADVPVIGVNVGKLGFLAEFGVEEIEQLFDRITTDKSLIEKRMMLRCGIESNGQREVWFYGDKRRGHCCRGSVQHDRVEDGCARPVAGAPYRRRHNNLDTNRLHGL